MARHTKGVAVRGINLGDVKQMPIIQPPLDVQEEFAKRVAAATDVSSRIRESRAAAERLLSSLQHRAFSGRL
jgi:type I restriction enzyme S subunit